MQGNDDGIVFFACQRWRSGLGERSWTVPTCSWWPVRSRCWRGPDCGGRIWEDEGRSTWRTLPAVTVKRWQRQVRNVRKRHGDLRPQLTINNNVVSGEAILSAENSGRPLGGRGSAPIPAGRVHSASPDPLLVGCCPLPKNPTSVLAAIRSCPQWKILGTALRQIGRCGVENSSSRLENVRNHYLRRVCLSVIGRLRKDYSADFQKIRWKGGTWATAEPVRFWW